MEKSQFSSACVEHHEFLLGLAMRLTKRDVAAAEDLVQDCLLKAWVAWDALVVPPDHNLHSAQRAWLSRVLANVFISRYRRDRQHKNAITARLAEIVSNVCPGAEITSNSSGMYVQPPAQPDGLGDEMLEALEGLPANQREVVQRFYFDEEPMFQIAESMGNSLSCTHKLAFRARIALGKTLMKYAQVNYRFSGGAGVDPPTFKPPTSPQSDADCVNRVVRCVNRRELRVG